MKRKLLLAVFAALVGLFANAQTWTASEVGAGYALLYNVGTGKYLTRGNGWNTQASIGDFGAAMTFELQSVNGKYRLRSQSQKGLEHLSGGTVYTDQSTGKNSTWTFTQVGTDNGPVYNIVSADNHGGGAGAYLTAGVDGTIVTPGADGTIDGAKWKVFLFTDQQAKLATAMASATEDTPVDVSAFIGNANFAAYPDISGDFWKMQSSNYNPNGGDLSNPVAESWRAAFTLSQTITVPNGKYQLRAQTFLRDYDNEGTNFAVVYLNDATVPFQLMQTETASLGTVSSYFSNGDNGNFYWTDWTETVSVTTGSITIGVRGTRTNTWCAWDNFQLRYLGPVTDLSAYIQGLADAVAAAQAVEGTVPTAVYASIADVITTQNQEYGTADEYTAAIEAINSAVSTYATSEIVSAYTNYKEIRAYVVALDDDATVFTGDATVDVTAADAAANAATTVNAISAAIDLLRTATATFISSVTLNEGKRFDITNIYLTNADFEVPTANGVLPPGWNITIGGANCGQQNRTDTNPDTGLSITNFIEAWHWSSITAGEISQTVTSLPEGTYNLECDASVCHDPASGDGTDIVGAYLFIKSSLKTETEAVGNVRLGIKHYSVSFSHGGSGSVQFGLMATNEINANWLSADNFKVYYAGGVDLSIYADALAEAVADFEALEASSDADDYATYKAIVDANNTTWSNSSEYQAAIDAVHDATSALSTINTAKAAYNAALVAANEAKDGAAYKYISGSERTNLVAAIEDVPAANSEPSVFNAKAETLISLTETFKAAAPSYNAWVLAKTECKNLWGSALGVADPTTAAEAAAGVNNLNVAQYNKVDTAYTYPLTTVIGDFSTWTATSKYNTGGDDIDDTPQTNNSEHWSGKTHDYYEQGSHGWGASHGFKCTYSKTATLPAGNYVVKVAARASGAVTGTLSATATDKTVKLPKVGATSKGIDLSGAANFGEGEFARDGVGFGWEWRFLPFTLDEDGEVTITINESTTATNNWFSLSDAVLLSDSEKIIPATEEDYALLNENLDKYVLGFDAGEFAPYNNPELVQAIIAAKAIDQEVVNSQESVQAAAEAITNAGGVANETEVNAVYNGDFSLTENNEAPAGWTSTKSGAFSGQYMPRVFNNDDRLSEFNDTKSAFFIRFDGTNSDRGTLYYYGKTETYTMPLKASTTYYVKADVKGWGSTGKPQRMNIGGPEGFSGQYKEVTLSNRADNDDTAPQQMLIVFTTTTAGDYSISFQCPGSDSNKHNAVVSNIELKRATAATMAISDAEFATFVAPFAVSIPDGVSAYTIESIKADNETLALTEVTKSIPANTPVVLFKEEGLASTTSYGYPVAGEPKFGLLTGVYETTDAPNGSYILQKQDDEVGFYVVNTEVAQPKVKANRAYLTVPAEAAGVKAFFLGGNDETAIKSVFDGVANGDIYDLAGRKVQRMQKGGVYVVNGKKVIVK